MYNIHITNKKRDKKKQQLDKTSRSHITTFYTANSQILHVRNNVFIENYSYYIVNINIKL